MSALLEAEVSRRAFLSGGGALILGFTMFPLLAQQPQEGRNVGKQPKKAPKLPGSLENNPMLDSWIRIDADGSVTVITGKVELGQGIKTALLQIAAEELVVDPQRMKIVTAPPMALRPNTGLAPMMVMPSMALSGRKSQLTMSPNDSLMRTPFW